MQIILLELIIIIITIIVTVIITIIYNGIYIIYKNDSLLPNIIDVTMI